MAELINTLIVSFSIEFIRRHERGLFQHPLVTAGGAYRNIAKKRNSIGWSAKTFRQP
ncbi:MAG: hypothetical protein Q8N45_02080 [Anaerolineales bacterium]|nr:hypothetical protein [Anaerolineales bacterium]